LQLIRVFVVRKHGRSATSVELDCLAIPSIVSQAKLAALPSCR
jgi:hypothetical protein